MICTMCLIYSMYLYPGKAPSGTIPEQRRRWEDWLQCWKAWLRIVHVHAFFAALSSRARTVNNQNEIERKRETVADVWDIVAAAIKYRTLCRKFCSTEYRLNTDSVKGRETEKLGNIECYFIGKMTCKGQVLEREKEETKITQWRKIFLELLPAYNRLFFGLKWVEFNECSNWENEKTYQSGGNGR